MYLVYVIRGFKAGEYKYEKQLVGCFECFYKALMYVSRMKVLHQDNIYYIKENKNEN